MDASAHDVVVIGGGISGLTTAWRLGRLGFDVSLVEAHSCVGGYAQTQWRDGFLLEKGPFNIIVREPSFETLIEEFSDEVQIVAASSIARARYIYRRGRLFKVPTHPAALLTSGLLSMRGRMRLARGLVWSASAPNPLETIEQAATRRLGPEAADTLVSSVVHGIFAGDIQRLGLADCFPGVAPLDARARSPILFGLRLAMSKARRSRKPPRWKGLVSLEGGLGSLMLAMGKRLGDGLRTSCRVRGIKKRGDRFIVTIDSGIGTADELCSRAVVVATPVTETIRLLEPLVGDAVQPLRDVERASMVVLNLGFRSEDVGHPLSGFGFLVPRNEESFPLLGVLWADSIFPHHAPPGSRLIRVFMGGSSNPEAATLSNEILLDKAMDSLRGLLYIKGDPVLVDICRHVCAIPQYHPGHRAKMEVVRTTVRREAGLHLVGNYLEGISLNDCVRMATRVGEEVGKELSGALENQTHSMATAAHG